MRESVQSVYPITSDAVAAGRWISLRNYERVSVELVIGVAGATQTLRLRQATNIAGAGAAALNFEAIWRSGARLFFNPATLVGRFQVGETITGAGAGSAVIHSIHSDHVVVHTYNGTVFVAAEVLTGGTGGATANAAAANFWVDTDILCRQELAAPASTFVAPAVANQTYTIEIAGADLNVNNEYSCIQADISAVGAAVNTGKSVKYLPVGSRYKNEPTTSIS